WRMPIDEGSEPLVSGLELRGGSPGLRGPEPSCDRNATHGRCRLRAFPTVRTDEDSPVGCGYQTDIEAIGTPVSPRELGELAVARVTGQEGEVVHRRHHPRDEVREAVEDGQLRAGRGRRSWLSGTGR